MGNQVGDRVFRDIRHLFIALIVKQSLGRIIKKIFLELDQSRKTNLRMFKFDNKLI